MSENTSTFVHAPQQAAMIRAAAVAGMFYPGDPHALADETDRWLARAVKPPSSSGPINAVIAPHAGFPYSGPIAGSAFAPLTAQRSSIRRVILIGPSHHIAFPGLALSSADAFQTPLGEIPVDTAASQELTAIPGVTYLDAAHKEEHALELHLPFLQRVLDDFSIVPIVTGQASPALVAAAIECIGGGPETLVAISSDLSHYLPYPDAVRMDRATSDAIEAIQPETIAPEQACGRLAIQGLLHTARERNLNLTTIDLRNSGDTAGDKRRVVGYGAYVCTS